MNISYVAIRKNDQLKILWWVTSFVLLSSWLLFTYPSYSGNNCDLSLFVLLPGRLVSLPCVPQTRLTQISPKISAVQSIASWGCWWAEICADDAACPRRPNILPDVVLVSRHTLVFPSNGLLPERMCQSRHAAFSLPSSFMNKVPPLNKSARIDSALNSAWSRVVAQC